MARLSRLETLVFDIIQREQDFYDDGSPIGFSDQQIEAMAGKILAAVLTAMRGEDNGDAR